MHLLILLKEFRTSGDIGGMEWSSNYIVYRVDSDNSVTEVFHTNDIQKAKYWISYIAQVGDVLVKTPAHPKHSKETKLAEYWSHKDSNGKAISDMRKWSLFLKANRLEPKWPEEQLQAAPM